jgi:O-succinylbenzoate synthase
MTSCQLFRYRLPLVTPVGCGDAMLNVREGLLIRQAEGDCERWAEAAPLPGCSIETLSQAITAARDGDWGRYPSLRFARASLDHRQATGRLPICALLIGTPNNLVDDIRQIGQLPHPAVKLKVARGAPLEEDIELVRLLRRALRPGQRLRLDANRGWTFDQARHFASAVTDCSIEYIEEPSEDPADFERLHIQCGLPYALDETIRQRDVLRDFPHAAALVVKPTLIGSAVDLRPLANHGAPLVFSASFESGVGLQQVAHLAHLLAPDVPAGLDTYRWLAADVLQTRLNLQQGYLDLDQSWTVDRAKLEEIGS